MARIQLWVDVDALSIAVIKASLSPDLTLSIFDAAGLPTQTLPPGDQENRGSAPPREGRDGLPEPDDYRWRSC